MPDNVIPFPGNLSGPLAHPAFFTPRHCVVPAAPDAVAQLTVRVTLDDADPPVARTLDIAGHLTLDAVHAVLQEAMGWWDSHLQGSGACPPEDVGGVLTYNDVADALRGRPGAIELAPEYREWLPEGFHPDAFDLEAAQEAVEHALDRLGLRPVP